MWSRKDARPSGSRDFHLELLSNSTSLRRMAGPFTPLAIIAPGLFFGSSPARAMGGQIAHVRLVSDTLSLSMIGQSSDFDSLIKSACEAVNRFDWKEAEKYFKRASQVGELDVGQLGLFSAILRAQEKYEEGLRVAQYNFEKNPCASSTIGYAEALADSGDYTTARRLLAGVRTAELPLPEQAGYRASCLKIGIREWDLEMTFTQEGLTPLGKGAFQKDGYYELALLEDDKYQKITYTVSGAARHEEVKDGWGHRLIRLYPVGNDPVTLRISVKQTPHNVDFGKIGGEIPDNIKPYLGVTPLCDPTTETVKAIAAKLKGKTPIETVANVTRWWNDNLRYPKDAAEKEALDAYFNKYGQNSEAVLQRKMGWCWGQSHAIDAILRACGIPARQLFVYLDLGKEKPEELGGHAISQVYLAGYGWVPYENNKPFGHPIFQYMPFTADTPVDINTDHQLMGPTPTNDGSGLVRDIRLTQLFYHFQKAFWGSNVNGVGLHNISLTLKRVTLSEPGSPASTASTR